MMGARLRTTFPVDTSIELPDGRQWTKITDDAWTVITPPVALDGEEFAGMVAQMTDLEIALQLREFVILEIIEPAS